MKRYFAAMFFLLLALAACAAPTANQPANSSTSKVTVDGGSYTDVGPAALNQMLAQKNFPLINVHIPYQGEIANTDAFIPYDQIENHLDKLPADKNAKIVLYCRSGNMSTIAAKKLVGLGYTNIWNLDGGMEAWQQAGLPLIRK
ncbi:MAG: rhodanese-like domain-containing protein [Rudaea sp.]